MYIVWGHNHFRIKSVPSYEVGLFDKGYENVSFDLQQKYAHLFYIPIFPLGKVWTINKGDKKKYVCPAEIAQMLDQNPGRSSGKSIFAWSGILAVLIIWGLISLKATTDKSRSEKLSAELFKNEKAAMLEDLKEVGVGYYLVFNPNPQKASSYEGSVVPFIILDAKPDQVLLGAYVQPEEFASVDIGYQSDFIKFLQEHKVIDSFWVSRSLLKDAVNWKGGDEVFKGVSFPKYPANFFSLYEIRETDPGPLPAIHVNSDMTSTTDYELINDGYDAHIDSIVPVMKMKTCKITGSKDFTNGAVVGVHLSAPGLYHIWFSDQSHNSYRFELDNTGESLEINDVKDRPQGHGNEAIIEQQ